MKELLGPSSKLDSSRSYNYLALVVSAPILKLIDWVPYLHPLKFLNNFVAQLYKHLEKFCYFLFQYLDTLLSSRCYKLFWGNLENLHFPRSTKKTAATTTIFNFSHILQFVEKIVFLSIFMQTQDHTLALSEPRFPPKRFTTLTRDQKFTLNFLGIDR